MATLGVSTYENPSTVHYYEQLVELQACETYLFDRWIPSHQRILDIGVGGGRTTRVLAQRATRYLGIDYSQEMVQACRKQFPDLEFSCQDASDLSQIADESFDRVIFSFNGIDCLPSDAQRIAFLNHARRILTSNGLLIFSVNHSRRLLVWPNWEVQGWLRRGWRTIRAIAKTLHFVLTRTGSSAFVRGDGYRYEPSHGGMHLHCSHPTQVIQETESVGFNHLETVSSLYPRPLISWAVPWYYYVFRKI